MPPLWDSLLCSRWNHLKYHLSHYVYVLCVILRDTSKIDLSFVTSEFYLSYVNRMSMFCVSFGETLQKSI